MASHVIDSVLFKDLFGSEEMRQVFSDESLVQRWLDVEAALARAEARLGIIPKEAADEITRKARVQYMDLAEIKRQIDATYHPIVPLIRVLQRACAGEAGEYIHWGATTQDIMDTAAILQLKEAHALISGGLREIAEVLRGLAAKHKDLVMMGRTHGQHALPITLGYKIAVWLSEVARHQERLEQCRGRVLVGQFAGAVGTLASLGERGLEVQRLMMEDLGLAVPLIAWHTARDGLAEFVGILGMVTATLGKVAKEVATLQRSEIGELEEPFAPGKVGSSTMPHKRNPMICEAVVAAAKIVRHNAPLALDAMGQEHERDMGPWQTEWEFIPETCILASGALRQMLMVLKGLVVRPDNMARNLDLLQGLPLSEAVMLRLAQKVGRQRAHDLVYDASMTAFSQNRPLRDVLLADPRLRSYLAAEDLDALLDPRAYTGLASHFVDRVLAR